mgnify:FL=1
MYDLIRLNESKIGGLVPLEAAVTVLIGAYKDLWKIFEKFIRVILSKTHDRDLLLTG